MQVLLRTFRTRGALLQLESRAVDAVVGAQRRSEHKSSEKGRAPAALKLFGQDVGRVGPEVWSEVVGHLRLGEITYVGFDLPLRRAPGEIGIGLRKPDLCEVLHDAGTREG